MKINFRSALEETGNVIKRFPLSMIFSLMAAISAILAIDDNPSNQLEQRFMLTGYLGLVSSIGLHLFLENKSKILSYISYPIYFGLLILYFFNLEIYEYHFYRFGFYIFGSILLIAVAQNLNNNNNSTFWNFNKFTILRLLQSTFFSFILNIGLSTAILALKELFNINWDNRIYPKLIVFIFTVFNSIFFLAGVPNKEKSEEEISFPNSLKLLSNYILIPIITLYAVILYLYIVKIIINWELPNGWVSSLVIYYSITGFIALYIINPIKDKTTKTASIFSKIFVYTLLPANILMTISIFVRIEDYSLTENRIIVFIFNFWLYLAILYSIIFKNKNLKILPISLLLIAFILVSFPINIMTISEKTQLKRFEDILTREKVINGSSINKEIRPDREVAKECQSIVSYLKSYHRMNALKQWIVERKFPLDTLKLDSITEEQVGKLFNLNFEFKFSFFGGKPMKKNNVNFSEVENIVIPLSEIKDYDYEFNYTYLEYKSDKPYYVENSADNNKFEIRFSNKDTLLSIKNSNMNINSEIKLVNLFSSLYSKINNENMNYHPSDYSIKIDGYKISYKIIFEDIRWAVNENYYLDNFKAKIYYKINNK